MVEEFKREGGFPDSVEDKYRTDIDELMSAVEQIPDWKEELQLWAAYNILYKLKTILNSGKFDPHSFEDSLNECTDTVHKYIGNMQNNKSKIGDSPSETLQ